MKSPLGLTAVIELVAGLALLSYPSATTVILVGTPLKGPAASTVARVGGAGLLSRGLTCWFARGDVLSPAARGLVAAMLLYDIAAATLLAFAGIRLGLHGVALWPAVLLHSVMAIGCIAWLRQHSHD